MQPYSLCCRHNLTLLSRIYVLVLSPQWTQGNAFQISLMPFFNGRYIIKFWYTSGAQNKDFGAAM